MGRFVSKPLRMIRRAIARWLPFRVRRCPLCERRLARYLPYRGGWRRAPALGRALDIVGSDLDHFECPNCGAHDRERHLAQFLRASGLLTRLTGRRIVHFAPERAIVALLAARQPADYRKCDLHPASPQIDAVDITRMPFGDASVDLLVANHVLEHVEDDSRALAEIVRVLAPGGHAILQTPYSNVLLRTWEDPGIVEPYARLQAYGQEDHVRLYGRDIFERFAASGLEACVVTHDQLLPDVDAGSSGVNRREPFFLFRRP